MVSFQCDGCADTVKKPQLDKHRQKCWASFTCLDCSTTFRGQDYKGHTSCISEAQKYQGSLYKPSKKGKQPMPLIPSTAPLEPPTTDTPADSPAAIHPSRLNQLNSETLPTHAAFLPPRAGRSGYSGSSSRNRGHGGGGPLMSGENKLARQGGMRSWGSPAVTETPNGDSNTNSHGLEVERTGNGGEVEEGKKKKRKGDKGGTGKKANSKRPRSEVDDHEAITSHLTTTPDETKSKKRKRDSTLAAPTNGESAATNGMITVLSEKSLKRIRKNMSKLEKSSDEKSLKEWLEELCKGKEEAFTPAEAMSSLKVDFTSGKWTIQLR